MQKNLIPLFILILSAGIGFAYQWLTPANFGRLADIITPKAISTIKSQAAYQFGVPESEVKILNSNKQNWKDICLDIKIPDYQCTKAKLSGYEVTVEINGQKTIYRGTEDGKIIRVVK